MSGDPDKLSRVSAEVTLSWILDKTGLDRAAYLALHRQVWLAFRTLRMTVANYPKPQNLHTLRRAYRLGRNVHACQFRKDGSLYMTHPIAVANILASMENDLDSVIAGLLHDSVEDTSITINDVKDRFGPDVAMLVDGVTKLKIVNKQRPENKSAGAEAIATNDPTTMVETMRKAADMGKIFLAMSKDLRVMVVKLADRLHNMRTLDAMEPAKQRRIAQETLHIFAPLAHRMGIGQIKWELEDLAFKYTEPGPYAEVTGKVAQTRLERQTEVDEAIRLLKDHLAAEGIQDAQVYGRPKHLYSIYQKMLKQELDFNELFDLVALRVIVHTRAECYHALGVVSGVWRPIPNMYTDYIAQTKSNMYQSLHIKVMGPRQKPIEIQIRTWDMHRTAEFGVAAHWAYKEKGEGGRASGDFERKLSWLRQQMFDLQAEAQSSGDYMGTVKENLFGDHVFVFTPKGDVIDLMAGSTPIDFAYRIHSDVGNKIVNAKVNGRQVPLSYRFQNCDVVEVGTRSDAHPSLDWLSIAKTNHARSKIKAYFKKLNFTENINLGRDMLQREAERLGMDPALVKDDSLRNYALQFNVTSEEDLLAAIGFGGISVQTVLNKIRGSHLPPKGIQVGRSRADDSKMRVIAGEVDNVMFRRSNCCKPIPGDEVIGYVTRGRGIALHRAECVNLKAYERTEPERLSKVDFHGGDTQVFQINLMIETADRTGLLADIGNVFSEQKTFITAINTRSYPNGTAILNVEADVKDVDHVNRVFLAVRRLSDVLRIERLFAGHKSRTA